MDLHQLKETLPMHGVNMLGAYSHKYMCVYVWVWQMAVNAMMCLCGLIQMVLAIWSCVLSAAVCGATACCDTANCCQPCCVLNMPVGYSQCYT